LAGEDWWAAEINFTMPCTALNCDRTEVVLPPPESFVMEEGSPDIIEWDSVTDSAVICGSEENVKCHKKLPFKYADLNFSITSAEIIETSLKVSFEIDNNGYKDVTVPTTPENGLQIAFYKNNFNQHMPVQNVSLPYSWYQIDIIPISTPRISGAL